jgi:hypothetical protein
MGFPLLNEHPRGGGTAKPVRVSNRVRDPLTRFATCLLDNDKVERRQLYCF